VSHSHDHDHDHAGPHVHPKQPDTEDSPMSYYERLSVAVRELLIEKGLLTPDDIRRQIELIDSRSPVLGSRVVARAWVHPEFRKRLLADAVAAVGEMGITMYDGTRLVVMENTPRVHNMVVCTLCSCYPRTVLGLPPDWYKSREYRARAVREPRALLAEFGTVLPENVEVRVHDSTSVLRYLVLPLRPEGTDGWTEDALAGLVTRDSMIGVAVVKRPQAANA
jgi:nitrile hydratase alpha subunit